jgi:hypothetical protein
MAALIARNQASSGASAALRAALSAVLRVQLRELPTNALDAAITLARLAGSCALLALVIAEAANRLPTSQP